MTQQDFSELLSHGPVILDGATGSNLRLAGMPVGVCAETWNLQHPYHIRKLQREYIDAGSQIIYAPTFGGNRRALAMHGQEEHLEEINRKLIEISREIAGNDALVAGDITTTGAVLEPYGDMTYDELTAIYTEQIRVLADAGADLLVIETMLTVEETTVALEAAHAVCDLPVICSLTLESDGNLLYGGNIIDAAQTLEALGASAVGLNCSVGPDQLEAVVRSLREAVSIPIVVKPNAGLPEMDAHGIAHYSMNAEDFANAMRRLVDAGANLIGGCCGTTPEYIRALKTILS